MVRFVRAYVRQRRTPTDVYYCWALWDAEQALSEAAW